MANEKNRLLARLYYHAVPLTDQLNKGEGQFVAKGSHSHHLTTRSRTAREQEEGYPIQVVRIKQ